MKEKTNVTDYENLMKLMAQGRRLRNRQIRVVFLKIINLVCHLFTVIGRVRNASRPAPPAQIRT